MASSAALMQGMSSFDSSVDLGASRGGGITFGSVATAFNEDEEDERRENIRLGREVPQQYNSKGKGRRDEDEYSSIMEEQEDDSVVMPMKTNKTKNLINQQRPLSSQSNQSSSRHPSHSTTQTTASETSPQPRQNSGNKFAMKSSVLGLGLNDSVLEDGEDDSQVKVSSQGKDNNQSSRYLMRELDVEDSASVASVSISGYGVAPTQKKKGGIGQNMTLREQEKVC